MVWRYFVWLYSLCDVIFCDHILCDVIRCDIICCVILFLFFQMSFYVLISSFRRYYIWRYIAFCVQFIFAKLISVTVSRVTFSNVMHSKNVAYLQQCHRCFASFQPFSHIQIFFLYVSTPLYFNEPHFSRCVREGVSNAKYISSNPLLCLLRFPLIKFLPSPVKLSLRKSEEKRIKFSDPLLFWDLLEKI